ncbi:MAG TPA: SDR family oxidoreductase [Methylomirabilota bacterium]|nr:SDR family oxidoreductase [Methylomirabilota bacterium]
MSAAKTILVVGGTSGIGRAVAHRFAADGYAVILAGRRQADLKREADDIAIRTGADVSIRVLDIADLSGLHAFVADLAPLPDVAVVAAGVLPDPTAGVTDPDVADRSVTVNLTGPTLLLAALGQRFAARGSGSLVGISSVAGDRGRARNIVYGAAKAGFTAALSGLRQQLSGSGVHVLTVKPGFVRTRMTDGLDLPPRLTASPERVARDIRRAVARRRSVIYTPAAWRAVMTVIRLLPEGVFRRTSL